MNQLISIECCEYIAISLAKTVRLVHTVRFFLIVTAFFILSQMHRIGVQPIYLNSRF